MAHDVHGLKYECSFKCSCCCDTHPLKIKKPLFCSKFEISLIQIKEKSFACVHKRLSVKLYFTDHMHTSAKNRINKATKQDKIATVSTPAVKLEIAHSWDKLDKMLLFSIIVDSGAPQSCQRVLLNKFVILCVKLTWNFLTFFYQCTTKQLLKLQRVMNVILFYLDTDRRPVEWNPNLRERKRLKKW